MGPGIQMLHETQHLWAAGFEGAEHAVEGRRARLRLEYRFRLGLIGQAINSEHTQEASYPQAG